MAYEQCVNRLLSTYQLITHTVSFYEHLKYRLISGKFK